MQCQEILTSGQQCGGFAIEDSQFCFTHDPDKSAERADARSKGGRARQDRVVALDPERRQARVLELLDGGFKEGRAALLGVLADVEGLENSVARARTLGYLLSVLMRLDEAVQREERARKWRKLFDDDEDDEDDDET